MRANVHGWYDREVMVSKHSERLARLYKAQVELHKLIIEDAETSKIEAAVSRVAMLSFGLTEMPHIPETVKERHERIMEKAFPKNAISGSPPRWKQWLVSLVAAYPLVLLFQAFIAPQIKDWPLEAKSALLPLCVLTLLTYVVMPPVSWLLRGWLHSSSRARRRGRSRQHSSGTVAARVRARRDGRGRTPARCWLGRPPIAGFLAVFTAPLPRQGSHPPRPPRRGLRPGTRQHRLRQVAGRAGPAPRSSRGQSSQPASERHPRP